MREALTLMMIPVFLIPRLYSCNFVENSLVSGIVGKRLSRRRALLVMYMKFLHQSASQVG